MMWALKHCEFPFCDTLIPTGHDYCPAHRNVPPMPPRRTAVELRAEWRRDIDDGVGIARTHAADVRTMLDAYDALEAQLAALTSAARGYLDGERRLEDEAFDIDPAGLTAAHKRMDEAYYALRAALGDPVDV